MKQLLRVITSLLLLMYCAGAMAQTLDVSGKVIDEQGEPIIGASVVQKGTSKHTQMAWALAEDGPKAGRQVGIEFAKRDMETRVTRQRTLVAAHIPAPEIHVDPGETHGAPTPAKTTPHWHTEGMARLSFNRGSVETYLQQKGDIHSWVSEGKYDIYA